MGLNWYGMDFTRPDQQGSSSSKKGGSSDAPMSANPILGEVFLGVLRKVKPKLKWEEQHAEHRIKYKVGALACAVVAMFAMVLRCHACRKAVDKAADPPLCMWSESTCK